ncbi:MAG: cyanophycinase [Acidobacteria bacterium]|nr:cyanophycinase [Acidobacteriota bacterium]
MKRVLLFLFSSLLAISAIASKPIAPKFGPAKGALVIAGGGKIPPAISDKFIALAGGSNASIVYIPTAAEDAGISKIYDDHPSLFGIKNLTVLHTRDRNIANTDEFVAPLKKATGVWFGGGRQWRLVDSYFNTLTHKELQKLLARGGVIGGTSAGASIQASYMVRGAREGNTTMMAPGYETGLSFFKQVAIDQHINTRKRESDLKEVITAHPDLLGIGLYESTAIVVQGDQFEVIGDGKVAITDGKQYDGKPYYFLDAGEKFDLKKRRKR